MPHVTPDHCLLYVIADTETKKILRRFSFREAHDTMDEMVRKHKSQAKHLSIHNVSHPSCPAWIRELDAPCRHKRQADSAQASALRLRKAMDEHAELVRLALHDRGSCSFPPYVTSSGTGSFLNSISGVVVNGNTVTLTTHQGTSLTPSDLSPDVSVGLLNHINQHLQ